MHVPPRRQAPTVRLRRLAAELLNLRQTVNLSRDDVAEKTNINAATVYRIETAKVRPQRRTLLTLLDAYGISDPQRRADLVELARQATELGWLQGYESELPEGYSAYISFEGEARSIRNYQSQFVPGLVQTEDYVRAVVTGTTPHATVDNVDRRVEARMRRQELLTAQENPLRLWAILDEAVLHRTVGGPEVMAAQLRHLVAVGDQANVTLQVVPFAVGAHAGMYGAFVVVDFPDPVDPDLVYLESMAGGLFLEHEADIRRYRSMFEYLQATALSPEDSARLIGEAATAMRRKGGVRNGRARTVPRPVADEQPQRSQRRMCGGGSAG